MNWWSKFWKIRKQKDKVKLMVLFLLVGIGFFGQFIYEGIRLYQKVMTPVEYIMTGHSPGGVTDAQMVEIRELKQVTVVSRQQERSLELSAQRGTLTLPCLEVSQSYLEIAYGIQSYSSMQVFYVNPPAYEELLKIMREPEYETEGAKECQMGYVLGNEETGMAKIILVEEGLPNDIPYAFHEGSSVSLAKNSTVVRIQMEQQDVDGMNEKRLQQIGLEPVNAGAVQDMACFLEQEILRMKYALLVAAISFLSVWCLKKYGK